jgi:hypothetical protein
MLYLAIALILLSLPVFAHTVTFNLAARIGENASYNTIRVNGTDYNSSSPETNFSTAPYVSINMTNTMAAMVPTGTSIFSGINPNYTQAVDARGNVMLLHLDNSTIDPVSGASGTTQSGASCTSAINGHMNGACSFDGVSGYINFTKLNALESANYSISLWINTLDVNGGILIQSNTSSHVAGIAIASGAARFQTFESGSANIDDTAAINDGQWHHIAVTKSGAGGKLYVDGMLKKTGVAATVSATEDLRIGTGPGDPFGGIVDEVIVYNRTLNEGEVYDLYRYNPKYMLSQIKQDSGGRFLFAFTNGTYADIERNLEQARAVKLVSSTFGHFRQFSPEAFRIFIRMEYSDIDLRNGLSWSGIGRIVIKNTGTDIRGLPSISMELIR